HAEDGIRDFHVTGVQTCALPISREDGRLSQCALRLQAQAGADAPEAAADAVTLTASLQWANQSTVDNVGASVVTDVVGQGQLVITKEGRNLEGGGFTTHFEGAPGGVLEYRVR